MNGLDWGNSSADRYEALSRRRGFPRHGFFSLLISILFKAKWSLSTAVGVVHGLKVNHVDTFPKDHLSVSCT